MGISKKDNTISLVKWHNLNLHIIKKQRFCNVLKYYCVLWYIVVNNSNHLSLKKACQSMKYNKIWFMIWTGVSETTESPNSVSQVKLLYYIKFALFNYFCSQIKNDNYTYFR